ncbi:MAG: hypothetical protein ABW024_11115 [Microbacterium sp.]
MGLFQQRPEEPTEWAGIPSDPAREETAAERLTDPAPLDIGLVGLLGEPAAPIESIVIPVAPVIEITQAQDSADE